MLVRLQEIQESHGLVRSYVKTDPCWMGENKSGVVDVHSIPP